jgi:2-polyprenyl-6-hydroxyphenyl methylase/3-demethylubiquinone-9 3-methyltransferase
LNNAEFRVGWMGDGATLEGRRFDLVLCSSVLEYVEDYWASFDWLAEALTPGGTILFSMPNGASLYRKAERAAFRLTGKPDYYRHVRSVPSLAEVSSGLRARPFRIESVSYYAAAPLIAPLLRRVGLPHLSDSLFLVACSR